MPKIRKVLIFLACAATFTFVSAQFSWESSSDYNSGSEPSSTSGSDGEQTLNTAEEPKFESYDIGPYSSSKGDKSGEEDSKKKPADKPPKEKKQKAARGKPSFSFSSAFSGPQKTCPVCASVRLKNNQYVDYSGGRIHVCSATCTPRVRRNPAPFAEILVKRGEQIANP